MEPDPGKLTLDGCHAGNIFGGDAGEYLTRSSNITPESAAISETISQEIRRLWSFRRDGVVTEENPMIAIFRVGALDRGPGDAVGDFLAFGIGSMGSKGMVEGCAVDILSMLGQMTAHRWRQVHVSGIGHGEVLRLRRCADEDRQHPDGADIRRFTACDQGERGLRETRGRHGQR